MKSFLEHSALNGGGRCLRQQGADIPGRSGQGFLGAREVRMRNMEPTGSTLRKSSDAGLKSIAKLHIVRRKLQGRGGARARKTLSFAKINN